MVKAYKIVSRSPTAKLKDYILQALAGQTVNATIAYLRVKASDGTILGEVAVTSSDWNNYQLVKDVTISTAGTASYFSLDNSDNEELYRYDLDTPIDVNANDTIHIEWTIDVQEGTNMNDVLNRILDFIIGTVSDIKIATVTFVYTGSEQASDTNPTVTADIDNDELTVSGSVTPPSNVSYDSIYLKDSNGYILFNISATGTLTGGSANNYTITVSLT